VRAANAQRYASIELIMKTSILTFAMVCFAWCGTVSAQDKYPLTTVRKDFNEASVAVRINIKDTKPTGKSDDYYYGFIASGQIIQSFKGNFTSGQSLGFYVRAENGYDHKHMRGDKIAFLTSFVDRRNGPFQELPSGNSVVRYSRELAAKVRRVALLSGRRRTERKGAGAEA
jgi:hypothetical protein